MDLPRGPIGTAWSSITEQLGVEPQTLFTSMREFIQHRREQAWSEMAGKLDYEVFDQAVGAFDWYCIEELRKAAAERTTAAHPASATRPPPSLTLRVGVPARCAYTNPKRERGDARQVAEQTAAKPQRKPPSCIHSARTWTSDSAEDCYFGRTSKEDLVKEMDSTIQVPGWSNIFTQPIINRIDMLATGVRTMIGVKVFGADLTQIQTVSQQVADVLKTVPGALSPVPDQIIGKGYLEITIDRERAARYGVNVGDVQDVIEVALGGKPITSTVEGRERHPVRIRYARYARADEEQIKNLLINAAGGASAGGASSAMRGSMSGGTAKTAGSAARPLQVPLASVADVRIVEGPSEIKSENGMLRAYVQLNVNTPDLLGFVEQAKRLVEQKVKLPTGMHLEWSGQFEHKIRADRTMRLDHAVGANPDFRNSISDIQRFHGRRADDDGGARKRWSAACFSSGSQGTATASPCKSVSSPASAWRRKPASSCWSTCANRSSGAAVWKASNR